MRPLRRPAWPGLAAAILAVVAAVALSACDSSSSSNGTTTPPPTTGTCTGAPAQPEQPGVADPLYAQQWFLNNTGQAAYASTPGTAGEDIDMTGVTDTGSGVQVAVVDEGLQIAHEDLAANVVAGGSHNYVDGSTDPTNPACDGDHGTSVAGLIAARADNGLGGRGVAPDAQLRGFNLLQSQSVTNELEALGGASYSAPVAIFNQSFGTTNQDDFPLSSSLESQLIDGTTNLRGGKGALYVKAAGNGFDGYQNWTCSTGITCQNANMDPANAVPYTIVVGAVNADGVHSSYSTGGSAIWVSATGGEYGYNTAEGWNPPPANPAYIFEPAMITTDQMGCDMGYSQSGLQPASPNAFEDGDPTLNPYCSYTSTFNGTSSATPVVSGVIALLLQANPALTWRDVKHILAYTAQKVDGSISPAIMTLGDGTYTVEPAWTTNASTAKSGSGFPFHDWYGFGRVDTAAAVRMAASYSAGSWPALNNTGKLTGTVTSAPIPDYSVAGATGTATVATAMTFVEAVQVEVTVTHPYIGVVGIELTSPSGTRSVLLNAGNGFSSANLDAMLLESNAFYGESPAGTWTLKVVDADATVDNGTLDGWTIRIFGH